MNPDGSAKTEGKRKKKSLSAITNQQGIMSQKTELVIRRNGESIPALLPIGRD